MNSEGVTNLCDVEEEELYALVKECSTPEYEVVTAQSFVVEFEGCKMEFYIQRNYNGTIINRYCYLNGWCDVLNPNSVYTSPEEDLLLMFVRSPDDDVDQRLFEMSMGEVFEDFPYYCDSELLDYDTNEGLYEEDEYVPLKVTCTDISIGVDDL